MSSLPIFTVTKQTTKGRRGLLKCAHGTVETPAFIFCATKGAIKGATMEVMQKYETQAILANTYNLMDYPGGDYIAQRGGLHRFMGWNGPMWTDSGGFQVFSLGYGSVSSEIKGKRSGTPFKVKLDEDGIFFQSPRDGITRKLTPELSMAVQNSIGSDFQFVLDECTPFHMSKEEVAACMRRSHRWELRSLEAHKALASTSGLYGIVQGGIHEDLRAESIDFVNNQPFFGHGIGGSLGDSRDSMVRVLQQCDSLLDPTRPKHLLGIGKLRDIKAALKYNIDTFDCVHPTRIARHAGALVSEEYWVGDREHINLKNAQFKNDDNPILEGCKCYTCQNFSRSYLHYLINIREICAINLLIEHNVYFMNNFMLNIRGLI